MISESDLRLQPFLSQFVDPNDSAVTEAHNTQQDHHFDYETNASKQLLGEDDYDSAQLIQLKVQDSTPLEPRPTTPATLPTTPNLLQSPDHYAQADEVPKHLLMSPLGFDAISYLDSEQTRMENALEGLEKLREQFLLYRKLRCATRNQ